MIHVETCRKVGKNVFSEMERVVGKLEIKDYFENMEICGIGNLSELGQNLV